MKVLLLHPEDHFENFAGVWRWDLIVDLARSPSSSYERWSRAAGCPVISLHQFEEETEDLHYTRELLQSGMHQVVDRFGIDWWDVLSLMLVADLQGVMLVRRLAKGLTPDCDLFSSRPGPLVDALQALIGRKVTGLKSGAGAVFRRLQRYRDALRQLEGTQLAQVLQDKFDREHAIRRRLARRIQRSERPVVLLPSAYINVSRTAVAYASVVPTQQFLLVVARNSGKLTNLPPNVSSRSLDSYFAPANREEISSLLESWAKLKGHLVGAAEEFSVASRAGILERMPGLIRWGVAVRNAWAKLFDAENLVGCLCADDSNPYTRIPLILAEQRALPALACHHGAMDARMAMKTQHGDFYLAKSEMERDYLVRFCRVAPEKVLIGAPTSKQALSGPKPPDPCKRQWLVFFTEPYQTAAWRTSEVYRDLLPRLVSLARNCGLKLVFKLHPFESVKGHRRVLRQYLTKEEECQVDVLGGPLSAAVWQNIRFAMTVQSTVALECAQVGIPVFLCAWLRDPYLGYIDQFARFGVGQVLYSPEDMAKVPGMLETPGVGPLAAYNLWQTITPEMLQALLSGTYVAESPIKSEAVGQR
ncbi:MAG: hypothetical protein LAO03_16835 [Acidobacteriia bacterium]|nr:hypothetical protein [Terriglobia bacterium]